MVYDRSSEMKVVNVVKAADAMTRQSWSEMRSERKAVAARLAFIIAVGFDRGILETGGAFHGNTWGAGVAETPVFRPEKLTKLYDICDP
jgi:hypothetical protein